MSPRPKILPIFTARGALRGGISGGPESSFWSDRWVQFSRAWPIDPEFLWEFPHQTSKL